MENKWISVSDKLPEHDKGVLVKPTRNPVMYGKMHSYNGDRYWLIYRPNGTYKENDFHTITHWMELPEPPKE